MLRSCNLQSSCKV
jgi:hypothetical protein